MTENINFWSCFSLEKCLNKKGEMTDAVVCKFCQAILSAIRKDGKRHTKICQANHKPQDLTQTQIS